MSMKEGVYYAGLILGTIAGGLTLRLFEMPQLVQLIGGIACGIGLGYVAERVFTATKPPDDAPQ